MWHKLMIIWRIMMFILKCCLVILLLSVKCKVGKGNVIMKNKVALITGSYGGLGTCFANIHASKGGELILVGRNQSKLDRQKKEIEKKYEVIVHTIAVDLSKLDAAEKIYNTCRENG